jgi:serine/threonine-protein kinase RsbW
MIQGFLSTQGSQPGMIAVFQRERSSLKWRLWTGECNVTKRKEAAAAPRSCRVGTVAVQVCLEEAVANIMMYSAAKDAPLKIIVEVERRDQTLVARIEDNGSAFDPTQVPRPPVPTSLTQAKVGNLGIHLMRSFASGTHYERRDGRNRLTMRFIEENAKDRESKVEAKH